MIYRKTDFDHIYRIQHMRNYLPKPLLNNDMEGQRSATTRRDIRSQDLVRIIRRNFNRDIVHQQLENQLFLSDLACAGSGACDQNRFFGRRLHELLFKAAPKFTSVFNVYDFLIDHTISRLKFHEWWKYIQSLKIYKYVKNKKLASTSTAKFSY